MNSKHPFIEQLHACRTDRDRAEVLLRCPDNVMLVYQQAFAGACRLEGLKNFVALRVACLCATRSEVGGLPGGLALELETLRAEVAAFAAGAPAYGQPGANVAEAAPPDITDL